MGSYAYNDPEAAFAEAEARIVRALKNGARSLDLGDLGLAVLPEPLGQLTRLRNFHLSGNQLTVLPDTLGQLTQLQELHLSDNQLASIPDSLGRLTRRLT